MKNVIEKNINELEVELPLGQRLLNHGYKRLTPIELRKLLSCDEIQKLEDTNFLSSHPDYRLCENTFFWVRSKMTLMERFFNYSVDLYKPRLICTVKYTAIESYLFEIPIDALLKVKNAKSLGLQHFYVAYPVVETLAQTDPIIIGLFENIHPSKIGEYVFIAQWD